jgi:hypothetical protein
LNVELVTCNPIDSGRWVYTATAAVATGTTVRIAVTALRQAQDAATDRPGGVAKAEEEKAV